VVVAADAVVAVAVDAIVTNLLPTGTRI